MTLSETLTSFLIHYGIMGLFLGSFVGSLIFFPAPLEIVTVVSVTAGYDPLQVAISMTFGSLLGALANYYMGYVGSKVMLKEKDLRKIEQWINKWGDPVVFITSLLPFPFDVVAVGVGILRMRVKDFVIASFLGKLLKFFFFAFVGRVIWKYLGITLIPQTNI